MLAALIATAAASAGVRINNKTVSQAKRHHDEIQDLARLTANDGRFSTAVKLLGDPAAPVRVGALHTLHRLALADTKQQSTILEVLCAYLRQPFHHPDFDREPDDTSSLPFGRTGWNPPDSATCDARDAEREVRRTCAELLPDLLPSSTSVRRGHQRPPLLRLTRAVLDSLAIVDKGFRVDITNAYFGGTLSLKDCYIEGDLPAIDSAFMNLTLQRCDVSREIFLEDVTVQSLHFSKTKAVSLILNGSKSQSMSFHGCTVELLDVSDCITRSFNLDEKTLGALTKLTLDDLRIRFDGWKHPLPHGLKPISLAGDDGHYSLEIEPQSIVASASEQSNTH